MLDFLLSSFLVYQYWLLFVVVLLASVGIPTPATALLMAGGAFYAQGYFDLTYLFLSGYSACILGDMLGYGISYRYGKDIVRRVGLGKILDSRGFHTFEPFFVRQSMFSVFITRFLITGLGPSVNILAGITKMRPIRFILADITGELLYMVIFLTIGYSFGTEWESILDLTESFSTILLALCLMGIIFYILRRETKKRAKSFVFSRE